MDKAPISWLTRPDRYLQYLELSQAEARKEKFNLGLHMVAGSQLLDCHLLSPRVHINMKLELGAMFRLKPLHCNRRCRHSSSALVARPNGHLSSLFWISVQSKKCSPLW